MLIQTAIFSSDFYLNQWIFQSSCLPMFLNSTNSSTSEFESGMTNLRTFRGLLTSGSLGITFSRGFAADKKLLFSFHFVYLVVFVGLKVTF